MRTASLVVIIIGMISVFIALFCRSHDPRLIHDKPVAQENHGNTVIAASTPSVGTMPTQHERRAVATGEPTEPQRPQPRTLRVPPEFEGFESWDTERQINAVTDIQHNQHLSPAMCDFLMDLASDSGRRPLLRNNAANALGVQDPPVPGWLGKLADQALDPAENSVWRDYALQHLSDQLEPRSPSSTDNNDFIGTPNSGLNRTRYVAVLTTVASGTDIVAGTALLHLDRLSAAHAIDVSAGQVRTLVIQAVENPDVTVGAKVTAFGILGMRKRPEDADIARRFLSHSQADIRRAAVAALGHLGNSDDIAAIAAVDSTGDQTVEMAKAAACKRLGALPSHQGPKK